MAILPFDFVDSDRTIKKVVPRKQANSGFTPGVDSMATHTPLWCSKCHVIGVLEFLKVSQASLKTMDRVEDGKSVVARCPRCGPKTPMVPLVKVDDAMLSDIGRIVKYYALQGKPVPATLLPPEVLERMSKSQIESGGRIV